MTTTLMPELNPEPTKSEERPALDRTPTDTTRNAHDDHSPHPTQRRKTSSNPYDDPTQGRQIGSHPYDDPTQGRKIGSDAYDDPTQGRKVGSDPYDDPTRARETKRRSPTTQLD